MRKHCHNCYYLEWAEGEESDPKGWACNKRDYNSWREEIEHLQLLNSEKYRFKSKRCFQPKEVNDGKRS